MPRYDWPMTRMVNRQHGTDSTRRLAAAKFNLVHYCSAIDLKEIVQSK